MCPGGSFTEGVTPIKNKELTKPLLVKASPHTTYAFLSLFISAKD